jgi:hypothetical protein
LPPFPVQTGRSGGADAAEELVDFGQEHFGLTRELCRCAQHLARRRPGLGLGDAADIGRDVVGTGGGFLDVAADLPAGGVLLLDGELAQRVDAERRDDDGNEPLKRDQGKDKNAAAG